MTYNPLDTPNLGRDRGFEDWASRVQSIQKAPEHSPGAIYISSDVKVYSRTSVDDDDDNPSLDNANLIFDTGPMGTYVNGPLTINGAVLQEGALANAPITPILMNWDMTRSYEAVGPTINDYYQDSDGKWRVKATGALTYPSDNAT